MALIHAMLMLALAAAPPLDEAQRAQLDTADDASGQWDTAALYPLLNNAVLWTQVDPLALLPGAIIADYDAIAARPSQHRGHMFILEGRLAASLEQDLSRPGPWGEKITRWVVQVDPVEDRVVVVYLTHAPDVPVGRRVRLPARFYKLWPSRTRREEPITYLTFVGHSAGVVGQSAAAAGTPTTGGGIRTGVIISVVVVFGAFVFMLRRMTRLSLTPRPLPSQLRRRMETPLPTPEPEEEDQAVDPTLPENPADALAELERRHEAEATASEQAASPGEV
jgi:hypothetical protein